MEYLWIFIYSGQKIVLVLSLVLDDYKKGKNSNFLLLCRGNPVFPYCVSPLSLPFLLTQHTLLLVTKFEVGGSPTPSSFL